MEFRNKLSRGELKEHLYRRRYVVPNAVTIGNLFCGFLAVIYASSGRFEKAVLAIILAMLLDGLDGRVARRLNATSKFGLEFDSFSDLVSFGVAPAMLLYQWCYRVRADEFGVFISFVYVLCVASRLARFNVTDEDLTGFEGLPSPAAAGMIAALVNFAPLVDPGMNLLSFSTAVMLLLSYLMVSRIRFHSVKQLKVRNMHPSVRIGLGIVIGVIWYRPQIGFLLLATMYTLSGVALEAGRWLRSIRSPRDAGDSERMAG